jgi:hypothetical protein
MDYANFRIVWDEALKRSGLVWEKIFVDERLGLTSMDRLYQVVIPYQFGNNSPHLFYITAELSWSWDALLSARFATTEDDLLTELFGREHPMSSELPLLRVNVGLQASVPRDGFYPFPGSAAWSDWAAEVTALVAPHFTLVADDDPKHPAVSSWIEEPEIQLNCSPGGQLYLLGVSLAAGQLIRLPRQCDDSQRRRDPAPEAQLDELFERLEMGLDAWQGALDELLTARREG